MSEAIFDKYVTHWMDLPPEPPKGEDDERFEKFSNLVAEEILESIDNHSDGKPLGLFNKKGPKREP